MILNVNPNRMELLRLKRMFLIAVRGHKLLKDKQDELVRHLLKHIKKWKKLRSTVEDNLLSARNLFVLAYISIPKKIIYESLLGRSNKLSMQVSSDRIANIFFKTFKSDAVKIKLNYGFINTIRELDQSILGYSAAIRDIVELASMEKAIILLADEINRTRRRVNALEYILIPNVQETIRYISMKMEEFERGNLTRLLRVKEIVRSH